MTTSPAGRPAGELTDGVIAVQEPLVRQRAEHDTASELLEQVRDVVEPACRAAVVELPEELRHVAGYHAGWWDAEGQPSHTHGKAVRPALVLAAGQATSHGTPTGGPPSGAVVSAAVAVELVHDFSLLHDDVMDGDLMRRHRPAAWAAFGISEAILVGDVLLILAMQQLATQQLGGSEQVKVLAGAVRELCEGQSADLAFETRTDVTLAECLTMAEGKTGALLGAACQLGALAAGADSVTAGRYRAFGRDLGVAFQLVDDLLGIWGDPAVTGKPAGADLIARKKSLPVVAALTSATEAGEHLAQLYHRDDPLDEHGVIAAAELIAAAGGRAWAQGEADRRKHAALTALDSAAPSPQGAADLRLLAELMTHRDR